MSAPALRVRIVRRSEQGHTICAFELAAVDGDALPDFSAGAHIDLHISEGLVRQYSLCNAPGSVRYEIAVLRDPQSRGGSSAVHDRLQEGDIVTISPPRNHFALDESARRSVLFAGGIGVTPLLSMMEQLSQQHASFDLHYCVRSSAHVAFAERLNEDRFAGHVHIHADDVTNSSRFEVATCIGAPDALTHAYICGPTGFIDWVVQGAIACGWPLENLHVERFAAAADVQVEGGEADRAFEIVIASTGRVIHVAPGQTAANALIDAGIDVPLSCEQGVCGTCLMGILDGDPDHRDWLLSDDEKARGDQFTPCCSRAKSQRLVVDL
ncbi:PDR/VanB family oxidoreductase [Caballeronia sp. LP006]|uniref:PDR/VanB family oxidoreductase n=1 Tax=Caballeronia sp. LP006 TaxID=3038552 RepID=UPI0028608578|nr:PDR/VanB family oxidoreductase [Caballeronia sp. LP006]MDR5832274.1 PDR/VanB family oxidoreductase [Caballeronia sp. LP006]